MTSDERADFPGLGNLILPRSDETGGRFGLVQLTSLSEQPRCEQRSWIARTISPGGVEQYFADLAPF